MTAAWNTSRNLKERIVVTGTLTLNSPTHLGNGDSDGPLDMPLLLDALDGRALLTGASIAGALRGFLVDRGEMQVAQTLFGDVSSTTSRESWLMVDDALSENDQPGVELRDSVALDPRTRTAEDKKKFDVELLEAGTCFLLSFELLVTRTNDTHVRALALALQGLEQGRIAIGKRKRRGFGECSAANWHVQRFDITTPKGILGWLEGTPAQSASGKPIVELLEQPDAMPKQQPNRCTLVATFGIEGSMMIRSGGDEPNAPDMVHLHSNRGKAAVPVLSGTSLAGALRARAVRIINTLGIGERYSIDDLFGYRRPDSKSDANMDKSNVSMKLRRASSEEKDKITASRIWVRECVIEAPIDDQVHTRLKIDRFTGGAFPGALFSQQPVFAKKETQVKLQIELDYPKPADIGLLLLLLKDLWTGDLPVGGESSVGRGRLRGNSATLVYNGRTYEFVRTESGAPQIQTDVNALTPQTFVDALVSPTASLIQGEIYVGN